MALKSGRSVRSAHIPQASRKAFKRREDSLFWINSSIACRMIWLFPPPRTLLNLEMAVFSFSVR